ncbi:MAG TPA: helix-turn-helix domain-containing protein [Gammaproteobacteria bacterium]|nr:helix-turn-helix domain-containing protein [Gammaproteobacteria bacterium]
MSKLVDMPMPEPTPELILEVLKDCGWTRKEAARRLGISYPSMRRYCSDQWMSRGNASPMPKAVWALLLLLAGRHPEYMLVSRGAVVTDKPPIA